MPGQPGLNAEPTPIVPPDDFPVVWQDPADAQLYWTQDRMHRPGQVLPLESAFQEYSGEGHRAALADYGVNAIPRSRLVNTYLFHARVTSPESAQSGDAVLKGQARLQKARTEIESQWRDVWFPEIQRYLAFWDDFDLSEATLLELLDHLDRTCDHYRQFWELHFQIIVPVIQTISAFDDLFQDLFGTENPFGAFALLEGFPNKTVEIGRALWHLSRLALAEPKVAAAVEHGEIRDLGARLSGSSEGRAFLSEWMRFLEEYGRRNEIWGLAHPTWQEDPSPALHTLRSYMAQPNRNLENELTTAAARREERLVQVRRQLKGYPQAVRQEFEQLLRSAQTANVLSEDHGFWIDFAGNAAVRRVLLEFGQRFVDAGVLEHPNDVFYLELGELRETARMLPRIDRRPLITERKAEYTHFSAIVPPAALGLAQSVAPATDSPAARAHAKFFGVSPSPAPLPGVLRGNAGAPGKVRGVVRVAHTLDQAQRTQPGEVLVAVTTAPPWTPLFATAAAVVTDTGGVLSHCAVVAREYGIPAVVGVGTATTSLRDGQLVEVDGLAGTIRVVDPTDRASELYDAKDI